jgi:hypothetical protein
MGETTMQEMPWQGARHTLPGQGNAGSVSGDLVNPALSMGPRSTLCQLVTSRIPPILIPTTPPP